MTELDLRLLQYFTVVARHGNVGRAAAELRVAQPSLSRQMQRLESQVGARLLDRSARGSALTAAGKVLLSHAEELLRAAERAVIEARATTEPDRLVVGHTGNLVVTPVVRELRRRHPEAEIRTVAVTGPVADGLLAGRVDAVIARLPLPDDGLCLDRLHDEPRALVVPVGHRLAGRTSVELADFVDEPLARYGDPTVDAWWRVDPRPDGSRAPDGPLVGALGNKFELVAAGEALLVLPQRPTSTGFRDDLVAVPIRDVPPTPVVLATRSGPPSPLVAEARALARELLVH
ncbi:LysR substrate-binding domain-containing protein [Actinomycetospora corticicola]|uniref:DNA-binding transcriptional LysR family regulator n=1 Tax=Actinomycetospora corticicola TaxID=663602 RepID=A0A7Y9DS02_9PSEU|nr:LysR family transcriptional regulator [Actinomycetospora corticicola]NYD34112.1 DNA-binding transcriptional LysR family regulator [Actinomycetospora corticicola]